MEKFIAALKVPADVSKRDPEGRSALHYAATEGHMDIVDVLVAAGGSCAFLGGVSRSF